MEKIRQAPPSLQTLAALVAGVVFAAFISVFFLVSRTRDNHQVQQQQSSSGDSMESVQSEFQVERQEMVDNQLKRRGIDDSRVLGAMLQVPRHEFVLKEHRSIAYRDSALPIEEQQTISQPYIVGLMTQLANTNPDSRVLDIGTGSGYQAAVLALLCKEVYSIEIVKPLADSARERLDDLGYDNVTVRHGDGYLGWPEKAPFDAIIVAAAPDHVPQPLVDQLARGGRLIIPVGENFQELILIEKDKDGEIHRKNIASVMFVPMTGKAEDDR